MLVPRPPHADWTLANAFHGLTGPRLQIFFQQHGSSVGAEACESQRPDSLQLRSSGSNPGRRALWLVPHTVPMSERPGQELGSAGECGLAMPKMAFRRSNSQSGPLLGPIWRRGRQACHVIALCMSCQSFDSGLPLGWGSCSQPSVLRSLIWSWLGLFLQWTYRHAKPGHTLGGRLTHQSEHEATVTADTGGGTQHQGP